MYFNVSLHQRLFLTNAIHQHIISSQFKSSLANYVSSPPFQGEAAQQQTTGFLTYGVVDAS